MRRYLLIIVCISGWFVAGLTAYRFIIADEARDEAMQAERDMGLISAALWDYAQQHDGRLPLAIKGGLPGYFGSEEFLANGYDFLSPDASLFALPASTPLLRRRLSCTPNWEIIRQAGGNTYTQRVTAHP